MKRFLACVVVMLIGCASVTPAQAQDPKRDLTQLSLEDLLSVEVVSAVSRYDQRVIDAPADVTIISADEIARHGYRTLGELLRNVRGFYVSDDRTSQYLGVRGFDRAGDFNNRILVLVDGHRMNDNIYGGVSFDGAFAIDLPLVSRVEIIRGPGASLYGTNALSAVINVVTRRANGQRGWQAGADISNVDTRRADLAYGRSFGRGRSALVAVSGGQAEFAGDSFGRLFARASARNLSVEASYVSRERVLSMPSFGPSFDAAENRTLDSRGYLEVAYDRRYSRDSALRIEVSFDQSEYRGQSAFERADGGMSRWSSYASGVGRWLSADVQRTLSIADRHRITAGSELRWDVTQDVAQFNEVSSAADPRSSVFAALFAQDEFRVARGITLQAGARHDHYGTFGGTTNPRLALILQPARRTTIKALYGRAFRAPTANELFQNRARRRTPRFDLDPERIRTYELMIDQRLAVWLNASVSSYDYLMHDVIMLSMAPTPRPFFIYANRDEAHGRGIEAEVRAQSEAGLRVSAGYSYQRTNDATHEELLNSPRHLATVRFTLPLVGDRVVLGTDTRYRSSRLGLDRRRTDATWLTDLTLTGVAKRRGLELTVGAYNLFDVRPDPSFVSFTPGILPAAGRTWRVGVRTGF